MPRITIQADPVRDERCHIMFSERVISANLDDPHYRAQLLERLTWATADAEAVESCVTDRGRVPAAISA